jgi:hypothetical protein
MNSCWVCRQGQAGIDTAPYVCPMCLLPYHKDPVTKPGTFTYTIANRPVVFTPQRTNPPQGSPGC